MRLIIVLLISLIASCVREPIVSSADAQKIVAAAEQVMRTHKVTASVSEQEWPEEILNLKPKGVRVSAEGLYVVTDSWFVEEAGLFIPRNEAAPRNNSGDPQFRQLHEKLFTYRIKG